MFPKTSENYHLDPAKVLSAPGLAWQEALKKAGAKLELLTDIDILLMVEKGIRGGICHASHRYVKANNKYMKDDDKNKEWSYIKYWDVSNLYTWEMSQNFPVKKFGWIGDTSKFNEDFIKNYNEESNEEYFLKVDVQYPKKLHEFYNDWPFLLERMKIEKIGKLATHLHDKTEYIIHMRNLKQAWNHGLILKKDHGLIKFNENAWLKANIDMNTKLVNKQKIILTKTFSSWWTMQLFEKLWKIWENIEIFIIVTTERRRNYLVSEPNYHTTKFFTEILLTIEIRKTQILMNKPVYLGLSILDVSKTVMFEFR